MKILSILNNNPYFNALRNIKKVLDYDQKRRAIIMIALLFLNALFDFLGLATIGALIVSALEKDIFSPEVYTPAMAGSTGFEYNLHMGLRWLYDLSTAGSTMAFLFFLSIIIFISFLAKNAVHVYITYIQVRFGYNISLRLNKKMFKHFYDKGYLYIKDSTSGKRVYSIVDVPMRFASNYFAPVLSFSTELVMLIIISIALLIYDPVAITLLAISIMPVFIIIYSFAKNGAKRIGYQRNDIAPKNYAKVFESMNGYVDVKLSNHENEMLTKYVALQKRLNRVDTVFFGIYQKLNQRTNDIIFGLGIMVIFAYAYFAQRETDEVLQLLGIFGMAAYKVLPSVNRMMVALLTIKNSQFIIDELNKIVGTDISDFAKAKHVDMESALRLEDITYTYPDSEEKVLDGISLTITKGESVGIIGASGSGKSTLLKVMLRLMQEDEGSMYLDDEVIDTALEPSYQKLIGYVEQDIFIINSSLRENIAFGVEDINDDKVWESLREAKLDAHVKSLPDGLDTVLGENGVNLSGGQKQRVGIARALYKNSQILFFDEATSALDNETEKAVVESINHLSGLGKTIVIVAHRITTLEKCDRIIELSNGVISREPLYADLIQEKILNQ